MENEALRDPRFYLQNKNQTLNKISPAPLISTQEKSLF